MITFNILGSCICRDVFNIPEINPEDEELKVNRFYQSSSPFVFTKPAPNVEFECIAEGNELPDFIKKCVLSDLNKTNLRDCLSGSDYFIFDLAEFRLNVGIINTKDDEECFVTCTNHLKSMASGIKDMKIENIEKIDVSLNEKKEALDIFISKILENYSPDKVIMIETYLINEFYNHNENSFIFGVEAYANKVNSELTYLYEYVMKNNPKINVVRFPEYCVGNIDHIWGKSALHYIDNYYDYVNKRIRQIVIGHEEPSVFQDQIAKDYFKVIRQNCILNAQRHIDYSRNILRNDGLQNKKSWKTIMSQGNFFDHDNGILCCRRGYAIINKLGLSVNESTIRNIKYLSFSVSTKLLNQSKASLFMSFGYYVDKNFKSIITDEKIVTKEEKRKVLTFDMTQHLNIKKFACRIYSNSPIIIKLSDVRLDYGCVPNEDSSLL
ncbi:hypothetical protein SAMN05216249_10246 [Acetitomaculum ruminis DSM 5522]|uniref:Uncharacterized protein n=1 Tax=Acetitomaculum ruminis DSM 5522 TaxID=1120918 RepID=A0A1I0VJK8_9FIRM|nr:DUF6270 domain-containing protein [Acetitomaculum ruminis]SFA76502.1 hypothetical protein SAMN05216249_10246 [Acetitomaculum ruminis DSM 5522]